MIDPELVPFRQPFITGCSKQKWAEATLRALHRLENMRRAGVSTILWSYAVTRS